MRISDWSSDVCSSDLDRRALVEGYVREHFVSQGMIADVSLHRGHSADGQEQPHAHVMLTMRDLTGEGFGKKNRDWNAAERLEGWRAAWADNANRALERAGSSEGRSVGKECGGTCRARWARDN